VWVTFFSMVLPKIGQVFAKILSGLFPSAIARSEFDFFFFFENFCLSGFLSLVLLMCQSKNIQFRI
jgi:hypothetical protein